MRFNWNNPEMPMGLRAQLGMNHYEAYRLTPHFEATSKTGVLYKTDHLGFRTGPENVSSPRQHLLLGGDSRTFGYLLPYEKTIASMLENKYQIDVYLQALPGGSPAFFIHDIFDQQKWAQLKPKPEIIIYAYDVYDGFGDRDFLKSLNLDEKTRFLRKLKLSLGGYFWGMSREKLKSYLGRLSTPPALSFSEYPDELEKNKKGQKNEKRKLKNWDVPVHTPTFNRLSEESQKHQVDAYILYLPRFAELVFRDDAGRNIIKNECIHAGLGFIDAFQEIDRMSQGDAEKIKPYFIDWQEGIHFSEEGQRLLSELIAKEVVAQP